MLATVAVGKIKCSRIRRGGNTGLSYPARTDGTARSFMLVPKRSQEQIDNTNGHMEVGVDSTEVSGQAPTNTPIQGSLALSGLTGLLASM